MREAPLDSGEHHVPDVRAGNAGACDDDVGDDLSIEGVDDEGDADTFAVPTADLQSVGAPAQVRGHHGDLAIVGAALAAAGKSLQLKTLLTEDAQNALSVDRLHPEAATLPVQERRETAITVGRPLVDKTADRGQEFRVCYLAVGSTGL